MHENAKEIFDYVFHRGEGKGYQVASIAVYGNRNVKVGYFIDNRGGPVEIHGGVGESILEAFEDACSRIDRFAEQYNN